MPNAPRACAEATSISAGVAAAPVTIAELLCSTSAGVAGTAFIYIAVVFSVSGTLSGGALFGCAAGFGCSALGVPGPGGPVESAAAMGLDARAARNKVVAAPTLKAMKRLVCDMILLIL
jgi:hypothetical protein